ncbi:MAG: hypothetical protein ACTSXK_15110 [Promethearchaeota archaeon]
MSHPPVHIPAGTLSTDLVYTARNFISKLWDSSAIGENAMGSNAYVANNYVLTHVRPDGTTHRQYADYVAEFGHFMLVINEIYGKRDVPYNIKKDLADFQYVKYGYPMFYIPGLSITYNTIMRRSKYLGVISPFFQSQSQADTFFDFFENAFDRGVNFIDFVKNMRIQQNMEDWGILDHFDGNMEDTKTWVDTIQWIWGVHTDESGNFDYYYGDPYHDPDYNPIWDPLSPQYDASQVPQFNPKVPQPERNFNYYFWRNLNAYINRLTHIDGELNKFLILALGRLPYY